MRNFIRNTVRSELYRIEFFTQMICQNNIDGLPIKSLLKMKELKEKNKKYKIISSKIFL